MPEPVQTIEYESSPGHWRFSSAAPDGALAGIVQEYWEVEGRLSPFRERVLPNGCTELMVNLGPPHQMVTHTGTSVWERAWYSGLYERAIVIESLHGTHLVNAVTDLEMLLGAPARELRTRLLGDRCTSSPTSSSRTHHRRALPAR